LQERVLVGKERGDAGAVAMRPALPLSEYRDNSRVSQFLPRHDEELDRLNNAFE
jgi:hypothetical protein